VRRTPDRPAAHAGGPGDGAASRPGPIGRRRECEALDRILAEVAAGASRVVVLRGGPGVGKSALLAHLSGCAAGWRVVRAGCVESEAELPHSGLHQLCAPLLEHLDDLPPPQADALRTVFGIGAGPAPDRFLVGLATLGLVTRAAQRAPLACLVDDVHLMDPASARVLAFLARRLGTERVALVCAARPGPGDDVLAGHPVLPVGGLADEHARGLLLAALHVPLDPVVRDRIVAESRGNPRTLLGFARAGNATDLAGGYGLPHAPPAPGSPEQAVEDEAVQVLRRLPPDTRLVVLAAAAEPCGDPVLLARAAAVLGPGVAAVAPAMDAELLRVGARVEFAHPHVRSALLRRADPDDRRRVHRALAGASDAGTDPDRRAWHRGCGASGPDDDAAAALERAVDRARARGGRAAVAAFLARATALTEDPPARPGRALAAASAALRAGDLDATGALLVVAAEEPVGDRGRARAALLDARRAVAAGRGDGVRLLVAAARRLQPLDAALAGEAHLDALAAAVLAAPDVGADPGEVARAVPRGPADAPLDLLRDALAALLTGDDDAVPRCRAALRALCADAGSTAERTDLLAVACAVAAHVWDDESWDVLSERHVRTARREGALGELPHALDSRATLLLLRGEPAAAAALVDEARSVRGATGAGGPTGAAAALVARRGGPDAGEVLDRAVREAVSRGDHCGVAAAEHARALLATGPGRYDEALTAAVRAGDRVGGGPALPELVESAAASGRLDLAVDALERLSRRAAASGTDWALGVAARSRALLSADAEADAHFRAAVAHLGRTRVRTDLARALLLHGEWLLTRGRRADARGRLAAAHELAVTTGMEAVAARAGRALEADGAPAPPTAVPPAAELTAQEAAIARLVRDGLSNPEIGARLSLSPRTVEWHLRKVFAKLGVPSRRALRRAPAALDRPAADG
jgi:DNA-binding CsgD family transcriptional regulator